MMRIGLRAKSASQDVPASLHFRTLQPTDTSCAHTPMNRRQPSTAVSLLPIQRCLCAVPLLLVDFDETLTDGDTIGPLVDAAIAAQARDVAEPAHQQQRLEGLNELKDRLVSEYSAAAKTVMARHLPLEHISDDPASSASHGHEGRHGADGGAEEGAPQAASARAQSQAAAGSAATLSGAPTGVATRATSGGGGGNVVNMEMVSGFLEEMNVFEQRMNAKVVQSGILAGLQVCSCKPSQGLGLCASIRHRWRGVADARVPRQCCLAHVAH